jgi:hypothetical protein
MTKVLAIALGAFGLAYACLWWSFQRFYEPFGVSPQDVGLSPSGSSADLPSAALQLGIWLLIVLAILAVVPTLAVAAAEIASTPGELKADARFVWGTAVALMAGSCALYWLLVGHVQGLVTIAAAAAVFAVLQHGLPRVLRPLTGGATLSTNPEGAEQKREPSPAASTPEAADKEKSEPSSPQADFVARRLEQIGAPTSLASRVRLAFGIFLTAAVVGIAFLDLPDDAAEAGACAAKGRKAVPGLNVPLPHIHLPILSVHAQPAELTWLTTEPGQGIHASRVVYLGQAGGAVVIYDAASKRTSRIPAGTVIVTVNTRVHNCPSVH